MKYSEAELLIWLGTLDPRMPAYEIATLIHGGALDQFMESLEEESK